MSTIKEWKWGREGVDLYPDHLLWYEDLGSCAFASGAGCDQSFEAFLEFGPQYSRIPPEMLEELAAEIRKLVDPQGHPLPPVLPPTT